MYFSTFSPLYNWRYQKYCITMCKRRWWKRYQDSIVHGRIIRNGAENFGQVDFVTKQQVQDGMGDSGNEGEEVNGGRMGERKGSKWNTVRGIAKVVRVKNWTGTKSPDFDRRASPLLFYNIIVFLLHHVTTLQMN